MHNHVHIKAHARARMPVVVVTDEIPLWQTQHSLFVRKLTRWKNELQREGGAEGEGVSQ